jgi:hypothetical protein
MYSKPCLYNHRLICESLDVCSKCKIRLSELAMDKIYKKKDKTVD